MWLAGMYTAHEQSAQPTLPLLRCRASFVLQEQGVYEVTAQHWQHSYNAWADLANVVGRVIVQEEGTPVAAHTTLEGVASPLFLALGSNADSTPLSIWHINDWSCILVPAALVPAFMSC